MLYLLFIRKLYYPLRRSKQDKPTALSNYLLKENYENKKSYQITICIISYLF